MHDERSACPTIADQLSPRTNIGRWRVDARWYFFALSYFIALKLGAALLQRVSTGEWPEFGSTPLLAMVAGVLVSTWVQAGEEVGWRGYLLPLFANRVGLGAASVVLGLLWALWHLPLFYIEGSGSAGQSFPVYASHVTALSVAMAGCIGARGAACCS